jgi:indolepyruvate ferredoxin oxidoreductase
MALANVNLDDKFVLESGRILLTGTQALVRLTLMQRQRDLAAGHNTAGYVTGYRGSPLGGLDRELWRASKHLEKHHVTFQPAVNEELAATAVWGSQQINLSPGGRYDGVFAMWYGKGPGVDRSGDAFRHGNLAGSAARGGVLLAIGDDPECRSSTIQSYSEHPMMDAQIPLFFPANVQEVLDYGLYGWALSRYAGCWTGMKTLAETMDATASVSVGPERAPIIIPDVFNMPAGGLNIRWPEDFHSPEERLHRHKITAALAFIRANGLNRAVINGRDRRIGIVSAGKSYLDVMEALGELGIDAARAEAIGLALYKVGVTWPLEPDGIRRFAAGLDEILVVEDKRPFIENQIKELLYAMPADTRPRILGKKDETGQWMLPSYGALSPALIAQVIAQRLKSYHDITDFTERLAALEALEQQTAAAAPPIQRPPYFCAGCPHNTSTKVPDGSQAVAGIGCHTMALWMDRDTATFTQMGSEGANWIGHSPFTDSPHRFVNMGDGTYFHSGLLSVRAAVAAHTPVTYKILYNDAVAMTGGQPMDGPLSPAIIARQVAAEGVERIAIVSDEPDKYDRTTFVGGVTFNHRDDLDSVQRELREWPDVSVLVYDQTCAAEKRRRRKRGSYPDPAKRPFINQRVCEGCGDCGEQSNCVAIAPSDTTFGRKRVIDQSMCNKDFSCLNGFCPSFVTVHGATTRRRADKTIENTPFPDLPNPNLVKVKQPYSIVITGIGGTGVVTVSALLAMAAHLEGKASSILDQAGLAQKNGSVVSFLRIAERPEHIQGGRIHLGQADLLLGCDIVTSGGLDGLKVLRHGRSRAVINTQEVMTGNFVRQPDLDFPGAELRDAIVARTGPDSAYFVDAGRIATGFLGDSIGTNMFVTGYAYQKGLLPVSAQAIERAIEINDVSVDFNKKAFLWGRRAAHDGAAVESHLDPITSGQKRDGNGENLDGMVDRLTAELTAYQDAAYAQRYTTLVARVRESEANRTPGRAGLTEAVARYFFKLMAYKDEYEVARLFTNGDFERNLRSQFEGEVRLTFHLAPPLATMRDPQTGHPKKHEYGAWIMTAFRILVRLRRLRGTAFDIFGRTEERKTERRLIEDYEHTIGNAIDKLTLENHAVAVEIAALPECIRGYGHIKTLGILQAAKRQTNLLATFHEAK